MVTCFSVNGQAQRQSRHVIDSLLNDIYHSPVDSIKLKSMVRIVARYYYSEPDSAKFFGKWAVAFADSVESWSRAQPEKELGSAYNNLGACYSIHGDPDSAMFYYDLAETTFASKNLIRGLAGVYGNRSYDYMDWGWYELAFESNKKCLDIALEVDNLRSVGLCYQNLGDIQSTLERYEEAASYYQQALDLHLGQDDEANVIRAYLDLAKMQRYFDLPAARQSLDSAYACISRVAFEERFMWPNYYGVAARVESSANNHALAEQHLYTSMDSARALGSQSHVFSAKRLLPALLLRNGRYQECVDVIQDVLENDTRHRSSASDVHVYYNLYRAHRELGQYKEAFTAMETYQTLSDSLADVARLNSLDEANAMFQLTQRKQEIALEKERSESLEQSNKLITRTAIGGSLALVLIGASLVVNQRNRKRRIQAEKELAESNLQSQREEAQRLQEVERMKSRFFANISHEFRTPLTLILGPAHQLKKDLSDAEALSQVDTIDRNGHRLLGLIDQLLELSRLENATVQILEGPTQPARFCGQIMEVFQPLADAQRIHLEADLDTSIPTALIDRDKLEKILFNLLSNAHKFTPQGGTVLLSLHAEENDLVFRVSDTGIGIADEHLQRVWDRFHQAPDGEKAKGSGIGLSLVKELTTLLGGSVKAESTLGQGATFEVRLPNKPFEGQVEPEAALSPVPTALQVKLETPQTQSAEQTVAENDERKLVLLVEDNADLRQFTKSILSEEYRILEAEDGQQGVDLALEHVPDLIVTDVMMPHMNGNELCDALKNHPTTDHIPIVMLTAKSSTANKITGLEVGADDYLLKPFNARELLLKIHNLITLTERNREKYREQPGKNEVLDVVEDAFVIRVNAWIHERISDSEVSVEALADAMAMSRSQLHRKMKALVDETPVRYIRKVRLHKGRELLGSTDLPVAEVGYQVGFSSPAYFTKSYREEFGEVPTDRKI